MDEQRVTEIVQSVINEKMDSLADKITNAVAMQLSILDKNKASNKEPGVNCNGLPQANVPGASNSASPDENESDTRSDLMSESSDEEDFSLKVSRGNSPVSSESSSSTSSKSVKTKSGDLPKYWKDEKPPKFHESEISPPLYLENLKMYFKRQNVFSDESKINCAIDGMRGQANYWAEFSRPKMHTYKDFKTSFLKKFWSEQDKLAYKELIFSETFRSERKDEKLSKFFDRNYAKARRYFPEMSFNEMRKRFANQLPPTMAYSILQSRATNVDEMQEILKVTEQYKPKNSKDNDLSKNINNKSSSNSSFSNQNNYQSKSSNYKSDRGNYRHQPYNNSNRGNYNNAKSNSAPDNRNKNWNNNNSKFERRVNVLRGDSSSGERDFGHQRNNFSRNNYRGSQNSHFRGRGSFSRGRSQPYPEQSMSKYQTERFLEKKFDTLANNVSRSIKELLLVQKAAAPATNCKEENSPAATMGGTPSAAAAHSKQCYHQGN